MHSDLNEKALALHKKFQGKLGVTPLMTVADKEMLSLLYTPGVAEPSRVIAQDKNASFDLTMRGRTVAVISDGSAILGLGNLGPEAAMPVMEGKALLMKQFAGIDAVPLVINSQQPEDIIEFVKMVAPSFVGINLEDIEAPKCFAVEEALQAIGIPVFHDDQHGTAIVVMAALQNAAKVVGKNFHDLKVVVVGAGSAGMAVSRMLLGVECIKDGCNLVEGAAAVRDVILVDSQGAIYQGRPGLNVYKQAIAGLSNLENKTGTLAAVIQGVDVVIGVSRPGLITQEMVRSMASKPIVFALANPDSEITPEDARAAGAAIIATGRSDYLNQINNVLAFPAIFKAVVKARPKTITTKMKQAAAQAIANLVPKPTAEQIIPDPFLPDLAEKVSQAVVEAIDS